VLASVSDRCHVISYDMKFSGFGTLAQGTSRWLKSLMPGLMPKPIEQSDGSHRGPAANASGALVPGSARGPRL
jgi:hypothetical protein